MNDDSTSHSITRFIRNLQQGEDVSLAQAGIFSRYFARLDKLASQQLGTVRQIVDGQDIAMQTMQILFSKASGPGFESIHNRKGLWSLLRTIAQRQAINEVNKELAQKRGNGRIRGESIFQRDDAKGQGLEGIAVDDHDLDDQLRIAADLVEAIPNDRMRTVVSLTLQGLSARDIAEQLGFSKKTIEREISLAKVALADSA